MSRKSKISYEIKIKSVEEYITGEKRACDICKELNIRKVSFHRWVSRYNTNGAEGLRPVSYNKKYSKETKDSAVDYYLSGKGSLLETCRKYNISSDSVLHRWIKRYNNSHKQCNISSVKENPLMAKGRKTTYDEKVEIVAFCIENNDNYQLTSDKYKVSYQQVYTWVRKYKSNGQESLIDNRGKSKTIDVMSESEKLIAQIKLLQAQNKRLEIENNFLKKLEEVERRR
ncbi:helix-turn-helix domain-containing protein [Clostridioides difficile]|uniref:helix-turn-helix domain-containing protein n=1 Tax=Clostridioides difficile TaxID=1496 RepID=UPI00103411BE|nr:helix-turn-helix domain-containing protein [Clostridioides difficile]EGT4601672.1 transposase [Clostridioides difficile]EGT4910196.1 transposase [Clostridioides difficile]EGT5015050.1 transposase [Clostridioides difficile]MBY2229007.1 helix-turn-helix domain-containing protein [Clostridioides difficile]MDF3816881.1 helix-turn-helix domain-containing protein [Clostridioides difficile]